MKLRHLVFAATMGLFASFLISCATTEDTVSTSQQSRLPAWDGNPATYEAPPPETPPTPPISSYFDWPVDEARFVRGFSLKPTGRRRRPHLGIDLANYKNTPILAAHDGTIIYVGRDFRGFGKMILIEGKNGWATLYAHLNKTSVKEGMKVEKGRQIASMGRTGRASGTHLHFELRKDRGPVDPMLYLPQTKFAQHFPQDLDYDE